MPLEPGQSLLHYRLTAKLGEGGMGVVWQATDTTLDRQVAIKILPEAFTADAERLARFEREAKAVAALSHPNILAIHDFGSHEGRAFAVMELLEGDTLRERLGPGPLPARKALEWAVQLARGLAAAHERGVVHRDLKPENVFVTHHGLVKILDFGLARVSTVDDAQPGTVTPTRTKFTEPGSVLGTVSYMSPEQARGEAVDPRTDLFSLGTVMYEMLAGRRPFDRDTTPETMTAILREEPPDLPPDIDPALARTVLHCLEKRPDERFQSARDLVFALEVGAGRSEPSRAPAAADGARARVGRPRRLVAGAALVAVGLVAGWLLGMWPGGGPSRPAAQQPVFERLTFARGRIDAARFSADGSNVIYSAHWRGRPPELFSVPSGNPESLSLGLEGAVLLGVSSRGELAIQRDSRLSSGQLIGTLGRLPLGSTAPRDLAERVLEADWGADGERIALVREESYLRFVESPPGNVLLESPQFQRHLAASPVDDWLVIWSSHSLASPEGSITLLDTSGERRTLTECACTGLAWNPAGDEIWFSERLTGGETVIGAVSLSGERREIWRIAGTVVLQDIAPDGRIAATFQDQQSGIVGYWPGADGEHDLSWLDGSMVVDLSDDGRRVLFNEVGPGGGPDGSFYLRDLEGEAPAVRLGDGRAVDLSPDGRFVLAYVPRAGGEYKIVPTGVGPTRTVDIRPVDSVWAWFLPDREEILINGREPGKTWRYYVVHPDGGEPRPVTAEGVDNYRGQKAVSGDGRWIAGVVQPTLAMVGWMFPMEGGEGFEIPGLVDADVLASFSADGRGMFVFDRDRLPAEVHRVDLESGERTLVHSLMPTDSAGIRSIELLSLTPDGRYYAYNYRRRLDVLYVIEGLE